MSAQQGGNDDMAVVESFKEALKQRVGVDHFRMWFTHNVDITLAAGDGTADRTCVVIKIRGQFALDRLRNKFMQVIRAAAAQSCGSDATVRLELDDREAVQVDLPLEFAQPGVEERSTPRSSSSRRSSPSAARKRNRRAQPLAGLIAESVGASAKSASRQSPSADVLSTQLDLPYGSDSVDVQESPKGSNSPRPDCQRAGFDTVANAAMSASSFVAGSSNQLAYTAMQMVCQSPSSASPLFVWGPSGTGKTHLLSAIAQQLRSRHRMRRVIHLTAEQFTNDFITSVGNSGIASFRRRYREVDALLVDDVQFLGAKRATLREMQYTVETLAGEGRPLIFSGNQSPTEISGLTRELSGRLAAGLVCPLKPLDQSIRLTMLRRELDARCHIEVPEEVISRINAMLIGDGRVISGVANLINALQRMNGRAATMDEIRQFGGDLLRAAKPIATLSAIENAVCQTFQLPDDSLRTATQTRAVSEPRMLAMHLSRQLTSAAYAEIAGHFGGRSHSTAIAAGKNVQSWLQQGKSIGRGVSAMTAQEAIDRVESLLRSG